MTMNKTESRIIRLSVLLIIFEIDNMFTEERNREKKNKRNFLPTMLVVHLSVQLWKKKYYLVANNIKIKTVRHFLFSINSIYFQR